MTNEREMGTGQHVDVEKVSRALSDRAALQLRVRRYKLTVKDCITAITMRQQWRQQQRQQTVEEQEEQRWQMLTLVRRGSAHCFLGELKQGKEDYEAAIQMIPAGPNAEKERAALTADLARINSLTAKYRL